MKPNPKTSMESIARKAAKNNKYVLQLLGGMDVKDIVKEAIKAFIQQTLQADRARLKKEIEKWDEAGWHSGTKYDNGYKDGFQQAITKVLALLKEKL